MNKTIKTENCLSTHDCRQGLQCEKALWLQRNSPELQSPPDAILQMLFDQSASLDRLVRQRFPGGIRISEGNDIAGAVQATMAAADDGTEIIYDAAATHAGVAVRASVLTRVGVAWDLVEAKSSSSVKDIHVNELAIQRFAFEGSGFKIRKAFILHLNSKYVRGSDDVDVDRLFLLSDQTEAVSDRPVEPAKMVRDFANIAARKKAPDVAIGGQCSKPHDCSFKGHCWKDVPKDSVFSIGGIYKSKAADLWARGVKRIKDVPKDFQLSEKQVRQVRATKSGKAVIDWKAIRMHLSGLVYPLHFLDFESVAPAIPPYEGLKPFQQLPFQASIHVQANLDGPLAHRELLVQPDHDPRPELAAFLVKHIGPVGSVIPWNASFEKGCLELLGKSCPRQARALAAMLKRLWDLAIPFKKDYIHPAFNGSWSIKKVLPVLVLSMGYKDLTISDGGEASKAYFDAMHGRLVGEERERVFKAMLEYCGRDTLGPVEILKFLRQAMPKTKGKHT